MVSAPILVSGGQRFESSPVYFFSLLSYCTSGIDGQPRRNIVLVPPRSSRRTHEEQPLPPPPPQPHQDPTESPFSYWGLAGPWLPGMTDVSEPATPYHLNPAAILRGGGARGHHALARGRTTPSTSTRPATRQNSRGYICPTTSRPGGSATIGAGYRIASSAPFYRAGSKTSQTHAILQDSSIPGSPEGQLRWFSASQCRSHSLCTSSWIATWSASSVPYSLSHHKHSPAEVPTIPLGFPTGQCWLPAGCRILYRDLLRVLGCVGRSCEFLASLL